MSTIWGDALERLSGQMALQNYEMWLQPIECRNIRGNKITLRAPNSYVRFWFESHYLQTVLEELRSLSKQEYTVNFEPDMEDKTAVSQTEVPNQCVHPPSPPSNPQPPSGVDTLESPQKPNTQIAQIEAKDAQFPSLNPRYTFDTFVSGPSNQLAFAAAQASSTYPPKYNPVFICGGVGLGKTHLLHSVGHQMIRERPATRVLYLSGEQFMNEYVQAIRSGHMHEFRRRYRESCDVLLVDDVQFLAGKDGTQDEFFHTFNALHDTHRQIVLSADRKPFEISDIADRLRSRFAWGLLADIEPPGLEVRVAILRNKAVQEAISLPDDVALYIASSITSNVRELEGALIRLAAYASLSHCDITLDFTRRTLEGSVARRREHLSSETVIKAVASYYGVKVSELKSSRRHRSIAGPRAIAMYLARKLTEDSYPDLGRAFGGKHHTTVLSAVEKMTHKLANDIGLQGEIHAIENLLRR